MFVCVQAETGKAEKTREMAETTDFEVERAGQGIKIILA